MALRSLTSTSSISCSLWGCQAINKYRWFKKEIVVARAMQAASDTGHAPCMVYAEYIEVGDYRSTLYIQYVLTQAQCGRNAVLCYILTQAQQSGRVMLCTVILTQVQCGNAVLLYTYSSSVW